MNRLVFFSHQLKQVTRSYSSKTLVQLNNAKVHRFGSKEPSFKNLSLTLNRDERVVIVGPVSAGKTTLAEVNTLFPEKKICQSCSIIFFFSMADDRWSTLYTTLVSWKVAHH